jgi:hypothetical protein
MIYVSSNGDRGHTSASSDGVFIGQAEGKIKGVLGDLGKINGDEDGFEDGHDGTFYVSSKVG